MQSFIEKDARGRVSVQDLAARAAVRSRTLARRFRVATGETPRGYLQLIRIEKAKRLLETTAHPVDRITSEVGYRDATAFRRAFIRTTGLGPRE